MMKLPISNRLLTCCSMVSPGDRVADVGTDHGYLGIYLLRQGIASYVLASDARESPLARAREKSPKYDVADRMDFFLSDGVCGLPRDFDTLVCAGMGADTIVGILRKAPWLKNERYRLILQPQSAGQDLRRYLSREGWRVNRELLCRDGQFFYTVLEALWGGARPLSPGEEYLSPALRNSGSVLLEDYTARCVRGLERTVSGIGQAREAVPEDRQAYFRQALEELKAWRNEKWQR